MYTPLKIDNDLKKYLVFASNDFMGGLAYKFRFPNNYGASVVKHRGSYGNRDDLFELAVMYRDELNYNTPITNDVLGYIGNKEVMKTLREIMKL